MLGLCCSHLPYEKDQQCHPAMEMPAGHPHACFLELLMACEPSSRLHSSFLLNYFLNNT